MLGAIAGDIIGSRFEFENHRSREFKLFAGEASFFTDDTVLTVATARWLLDGESLADVILDVFQKYPNVSYGGSFANWALDGGGEPYNSYGNGSAMRVSPVAYAARDEQECLDLAEESAAVTHNHPEGIKGAQATAWATWMALQEHSGPSIKAKIEDRFGYDMQRDWFSGYDFDVTCQGTVPPALICALDATSYEDFIRAGVSIGGDTDTICAIGGAVAEALFGVPEEIAAEALKRLDDYQLGIVGRFKEKFG
jgi:ADP-ribosyl-[dinitrogen reductase] hydrolase